jgi:alpha-N-acetylglucosaminidase
MKTRFGCAVVVVLLLCRPTACAGGSPEKAARDLLQRLLPERISEFILEAIPADSGHDVFELETAGGKIVIRGSSGVAIASGLNWYLKYYGKCHVSWCGDQLKLPRPLPAVPQKVRRVSPFRYRYCFNYCAFSYTLAFWDWPQWERMIDWMALHGINMPLAVTGQEAVWHKVYRDLGLSDEEIGKFLVGPAYLPFGWMGCIDGWGGPLPHSWIERHAELQKRILARQRELGMTPVLQGFTGHVPESLKRVFPQAQFRRLPSWCEFPGTHFLDPMDPLFQRVGKAFVKEQTRQFGTDHLYASDTFIEMSPPSNDPKFLAGMGKAVYQAMAAADPEAVWVMQGWLFFNNPSFWKPPQAKAMLGAVPDDRMIVLDLYCENTPTWNKTEAFHGKPWAWSIIQSFGAQVSLHGGLPQIAKNLGEAMAAEKGTGPICRDGPRPTSGRCPASHKLDLSRFPRPRGRLSGLGLLMEGFGYNPVVYDFLTEMTWRSEVPKLEPWTLEFVRSRYGRQSPAAEEAWKLLLESAYTAPGQAGSILCARPKLDLAFGTSYDSVKLALAWQKLLGAAAELGDTDTYRFDVVNLTRQVLTNLAPQFYADAVAAYRAGDVKRLAESAARYLGLLKDMDELLATRREFLLGKWLSDAKHWATSDAERKLYEWNARSLITLWGPRDSILHEYSQREWSGMLRGFYLPRWKMFFARLEESLARKKPLDEKRLESELRDWDAAWVHKTDAYPDGPAGDAVAVARRLWGNYGQLAVGEIDGKSLTTGKPATCSASLPPYPAGLANDGRTWPTDRYWATDVNVDKAAWWQVDLEKPAAVGRVAIVFYYGDRRYYGFTVEGSLDGKTWAMLADRRDNKEVSTRQGITCRFSPRPVRYLRVTVTHNSANTGRHLVEVMAFE